MSLPQTVYFSISNFWYKLTQPTVHSTVYSAALRGHNFHVVVDYTSVVVDCMDIVLQDTADNYFTFEQ